MRLIAIHVRVSMGDDMKGLGVLVLTCTLLAAGCAARTADLAAPALSGSQAARTVLVKGLAYDRYGLPKFGAPLAERPGRIGDRFSVVYYADSRPVKSYEIAVVGQQKPDITRPFEVMFQWTGEGFMVGAAMVWGSGPVQFSYDARTNMVYTTASVAPIVVMATGGFIVGIVAGMFAAGEELGHALVRPQEMALSATTYEYDRSGRLKRMRMFLPDEKTEVVRTEYFYGDGELVPVRTESRSYPENRLRTIGK